MRAVGLRVVLLVSVAGCGSTGTPGVRDGGLRSGDAPAINPPFLATGPIDPTMANLARRYAGEYQGWGRVDDGLRWAPTLCRMPLPGRAYPSTSMDASTHGQKLYSVFVKNHAAYPDGPHADQVVIKESWVATPVTDGTKYAPDGFRGDGGDHFYPYAMKDGALYRASARAGLYLMFKVDPIAPESDDGWVYATVDVQGQVTSAGRVPSCMGCHRDAGHERLFGVPTAP